MQIAINKSFAFTRFLLIALGAAVVVLAGDAWAQNAQSPSAVQNVKGVSAQPTAPNSQAPETQQAAQSPQTAQAQQAAQTPQGEQTQQGPQTAQVAQVEQAAQNAEIAEPQQTAARPIVPLPSYQQLVAGLLVRTRF